MKWALSGSRGTLEFVVSAFDLYFWCYCFYFSCCTNASSICPIGACIISFWGENTHTLVTQNNGYSCT